MSDEINHPRRRLLGTAAIALATTQFAFNAFNGIAEAQPAKAKPAGSRTVKPGTHTSFASLKQVDAGLLNVGYAEAGPADGPAVILLHGWPYDIYSFVDVAPLLASAGYRVIVPYLRGYGTTRFLSDTAVRNGQPSAIATDTIALMDALKIEKATLGGFDWGARTANIMAALWPERCRAMVSVSGYLIGSQEAGRVPLPPKPSCNGGISFISPLSAGVPATTSIATTSRSSSGRPRRRNGTSTTPPSIAAQRLSTTPITSRS
jgi:pimeloyl-ACP methyl ester carboxylesterase